MHRRRFLQASLASAVALHSANRHAFAAILGPTDTVTADVDAITGEGREVTLARAAVQELGDSLRGNLLLPGHDAYEQARRVLNPTIDRLPALIVQPKGVADVRAAVQFARSENLLTAVKCGGHSASGKSTCDRGLQIDLSLLRSARVDPKRRIAYISGGSWLGDLDHESMAFGLVTTAGTVSHTGVGGLTLGGGFGRLARRFGLAADNVKAVQIVTPDGQYLRADPEENPDLFWAVRGGGGNFGIVTDFEFGLHPMQREVIAGELIYPIEEAKQVLSVYAEYSEQAPDELYIDGGLVSGGGNSAVLIGVCYSGDPALADRVLAPLRKAGTVISDTVRTQDYVAVQKSGDISDPRARGLWIKSGFIDGIKPGMIEAMVDGLEPDAERATFAGFQHAGGAIGRVPNDATAFAHRYVSHDTLFFVSWPFGADATRHVQYLRDYFSTVGQYTEGFYVNDIGDQSQQQVNSNYRGNFEKLTRLKAKYDPTNLFRLNANITPASS